MPLVIVLGFFASLVLIASAVEGVLALVQYLRKP